MTEEFRIITETQYDRACDEVIGRLVESMKNTRNVNNVLVLSCIEIVQLAMLDLERTLFKEEATLNG